MKTMRILLALLFAIACSPLAALAAPTQYVDALAFYSTHTGEADGQGLTPYVAYGGVKPMSGSQAAISFASLTSDAAAARLYLLVETGDKTTVDVAVTASNNTLPVAATSGLSLTPAGGGSWIAIYDPSTGYFEVDRVSSGTAATNVALCGTTDHAYTTAAQVIELSAAYSVPVGNATVTFQGGDLFYGKVGQVLGWYVDGTSACRVNAITGSYKR